MLQHRSLYLYIIFGLFGIILILVGIQQPASSVWQSIFVNLGVGALIAILLGVTVERVASDNFKREVDDAIKRIEQSVLIETLNKMLPKTVAEEVQSNIFSQNLIRRNLYVAITLSEDDDLPNDFLRQTLSVSYELENFGQNKMPFSIKNSASLFQKPPDGWIVYREVRVERQDGSCIERSGQDLQNITSRGELAASFDIPIVLKPRESVQVHFIRDVVAHRRDRHTIIMPLITENFTVVATVPRNFLVEASIWHPAPYSDSETQRRRIRMIPGIGTTTWEIKGCLLLYQGVEIAWTPK
jgi:hypothetical protein